MMRVWTMIVVFSLCLRGVALAQEMPLFDSGVLSMMMDQQQKKPKTEAESMAFVQSYFLEMMFLKPMFETQPSMLSEEEKAEMGSLADTTMQDQLITREMATRLAKQDVLGLNKHFKRSGGAAMAPVEQKVPRYSGGFVMGKVPE